MLATWASSKGPSKQDLFYTKAKEFNICLEEITKNYDKQTNSITANVIQGKQLAQSFSAYKRVAAFHTTVLPIVDFLQKSSHWLTVAEDLAAKFANSMTDKSANPTKESVKSQLAFLKATKQKKRTVSERPNQTLRPKPDEKKGYEECAFEIEEMTMNSLYSYWESYCEFLEENMKLLGRIKEGISSIKKSSADAMKAKRNASKKIFAVPLEELAEREAPAYLPKVLEDVLSQIDKLANMEGIFRVSGSKTGVDSLREAIDSGNIPDFSAVSDPHTVPSLFKSFLRLLPISLIPYDSFLTLPPNLNDMSAEDCISYLKTLVKSLPPSHYHLLGRLLKLCQKIVSEKAVTKMNSSNIAVVLGPNVIRPPDNSGYSPDSFGDSNTIVQLLIDHFTSIYPEKISNVATANADENFVPMKQSGRKLRAHGMTLDNSTVTSLNFEASRAEKTQSWQNASGHNFDSPSPLSPSLSSSSSSPPLSPPVSLSPPSSPSLRPPRDPPASLHPPNRVSSRDDNSTPTSPPLSGLAPNVPQRNFTKSPSTGALPVSTTTSAPIVITPSRSPNPKAAAPIGSHPKPPAGPPPTHTTPPPAPLSLSTSPPTQQPTTQQTQLGVPTTTPNKKIIGKPAAKKSPSGSPQSSPTPTRQSNLVASASAPSLNIQPAQQTQDKTQQTQEKTHASASSQENVQFRAARPSTIRTQDVSIDIIKADIHKLLSVVVESQLGLVRTKFAEVKSIPEGVPFIHVLKAITPELDKLKKNMPTPPIFEKLPELPPDANKLTRLKFTLDFALKDLTRVLEQVGKFVNTQDNPSEIPLLNQIQQIISSLNQILTTNISKL